MTSDKRCSCGYPHSSFSVKTRTGRTWLCGMVEGEFVCINKGAGR